MTHVRDRFAAVLLVTVLAAGIVVGALPRGQAADTRLEAESMSLASKYGGVFSDGAASGGKGLIVWANGTASASVTTPKAVRLVVRARGDQRKGAPAMTVKIDGNTLLKTAVTQTSWTDHAKDLSLGAGTHKVSVVFTNDYRTKTCDRNLRLDVLTFVEAPAPTVSSFESESMSLPSGSGQAFSDAAASGGGALLIWSNATATKTVGTVSGDRLVVRARGDQCEGAPTMRVVVDGATVLDTPVPATSWTDYAAPAAISAASHTVSVAFTNDHMAGCDRNLRIDKISVTTSSAPAGALYVDPDSAAKTQADEWRSTRPADAAQIDKIASQAQAFWLGSWSGDVRAATDRITGAAAAAGKVPVLVAYNIPNRDCGGYSSGGASSADAYRSWIRSFADGIGPRQAVVVLEPDAVTLADCLASADRSARYDLLRDAVSVLESHAGVAAYIDAGHSRWLSPSEAASRLQSAGIAQATGFSLNVSNYGQTADEVAYGKQVSSGASGKPFVVDTSRNGLGPHPSGEWCNPSGRALGDRPTLDTGVTQVDAYLWVKRPGESDGTCNGGPAAGQWWADYALGLARRAAY